MPSTLESNAEGSMPGIVDLNAKLAKLTMFRRTPGSTRAERQGSVAQLAVHRDGLLFAFKFAGKDHWERHLTGDELIQSLDGSTTMEIVCDDGAPRPYMLHAGTVAVIPQGAWHRFHAPTGVTQLAATPFPGETIALDVDDPRTVERTPAICGEQGIKETTPSIVDLKAELAKLTLFRGRTPQWTMADRQGSGARLAGYRDGGLLTTKFAGKGHRESHRAGDELIHVLDGSATLERAGDDGLLSNPLRAGTLAVIPQAVWHRFHSADGVTLMTATPFPSAVIALDIDEPMAVAHNPA